MSVAVDATESGNGKLEILINDGEVLCHVENNGARKFLATFSPEEPIMHKIRILFNEVEVPG